MLVYAIKDFLLLNHTFCAVNCAVTFEISQSFAKQEVDICHKILDFSKKKEKKRLFYHKAKTFPPKIVKFS